MPTQISKDLKTQKANGVSRRARRYGTKAARHGQGKINAGKKR